MGRRRITYHDTRDKTPMERQALREALRQAMETEQLYGANGARLRAQSYEVMAIDKLVSIMCDERTPVALQRLAALDILEQARGKVAPQLHDGRTVDPEAPSPDGSGVSVGAQIEAARVSAEMLRDVQDCVQSGMPWSSWPERIRDALSPDMAAAFAVEESDEATAA